MCKVSSFIICENVQTLTEKTDNGEIIQKPQIINPINTISLYSIPSYFTFAIFGNLTEIDDDCDNATIYIEIYKPNGLVYFKSKELPLPIHEIQNSDLKFSYDIRNFTFEYYGKYNIKLYVKNNCIAETQFTVEERSD